MLSRSLDRWTKEASRLHYDRKSCSIRPVRRRLAPNISTIQGDEWKAYLPANNGDESRRKGSVLSFLIYISSYLTPGIVSIGVVWLLESFRLVFFDSCNHSDWCFLLVVVFWLSVFWLFFFELVLVFLGWRFFVTDFRATVRLSPIDITNVVMIALPTICLSSLPLGRCHY